MKYLIIILLFASCSPLKSYRKVANDPFRNSSERTLLARAYASEFRDLKDTPRIVSNTTDSSLYEQFVESYNELTDSLIAAYDRQEKLEKLLEQKRSDSDSSTPKTTYCKYSKADSLRIARAAVNAFKPPPVINREKTEVPVTNGGEIFLKDLQLGTCRQENDKLSKEATAAKDSEGDAKKTRNWLWVIASLMGAGYVFQVIKKFSV